MGTYKFFLNGRIVELTTEQVRQFNNDLDDTVDFSQWGDIETKALSKINILTGKFIS